MSTHKLVYVTLFFSTSQWQEFKYSQQTQKRPDIFVIKMKTRQVAGLVSVS